MGPHGIRLPSGSWAHEEYNAERQAVASFRDRKDPEDRPRRHRERGPMSEGDQVAGTVPESNARRLSGEAPLLHALDSGSSRAHGKDRCRTYTAGSARFVARPIVHQALRWNDVHVKEEALTVTGQRKLGCQYE